MEITEEQRRRAEANRLAALEKRKHVEVAVKGDPWKLFKCTKIPRLMTCSGSEEPPPPPPPPPPDQFLVILEICSPDEFSVTPERVPDSPFPGLIECFKKIDACLSPVTPALHTESDDGRRASVFKLKDYDMVSRCLKKIPGLRLQEVPWQTRSALLKFSCSSVGGRWVGCSEEHISDDDSDKLILQLPTSLRNALLPFQIEGVRFGLQRGGRCLIADEMGLGKSIQSYHVLQLGRGKILTHQSLSSQAIAIASCFMNEGPILVVCPAILRFSWAEELEHWLPSCLPTDIHLVFGHQDNLDHLKRFPRIVVISYTMLHRLRRSMLRHTWALMVIDESHNIRCTKKASESEETNTVLDVATTIKRVIMLSGTPSLSRPYDIFHQINILCPHLLGKDKFEFANNYCSVKLVQGAQGKIFKDFSKGVRLEELNVLLRQTVMVRRLKEHVLVQLPPKRRQVIRLKLKGTDILLATAACTVSDIICSKDERQNESVMNFFSRQNDADGEEKLENLNECNGKNSCRRTSKQLSYQELGIAKLSGFREWFANHTIAESEDSKRGMNMGFASQKMIIFAHHLKVLDGIQEFICERGITFVRIDGSTIARDRQAAVEAFRSSVEVTIAIIGITAGGVGLDFSSAQNVVFVELPKSASQMLQAEDRAHRRGQTNAVNIYIFCAKDTSDEFQWLHLNKSLYRVSSMMNGNDALNEIEVDSICHLEYAQDYAHHMNLEDAAADDHKHGTSAICVTQAIDSDPSGEFTISNNEITEATKVTTSLSFFPQADKRGDQEKNEHATLSGALGYNDSEVLGKGNFDSISTCKLDRCNLENDLNSDVCMALPFSDKQRTIPQTLSANCLMQSDNMPALMPEAVDGNINDLIEADASSSFQPDSLRFEVSQYTGRVHLYVCTPGMGSRPSPLFENFRPEELDSLVFSASCTRRETELQLMKENPIYWDVFRTFIKEWNDLRPVERKKLSGKPLQPPLYLELSYLKESINHGWEGLIKGGSKRRVTPVSDISHSLPENAVWKMINLNRGSRKEKEYAQGWSVTNEPLCKLCQTPCNGRLAKTPEYFEDLFCNLSCYQEYRIRTSQRSLREALFQIEHGVCTQCKLDCHKLVQCIRRLSIRGRQEYIEKLAPKLACNQKLFEKLVYEPTEGNAWHADHIVPVYRGGGECRLENMRTLCVACHSEVTKAQRAERLLTRNRAKEMLKAAIKELKDGDDIKDRDFNEEKGGQLEAGEDAEEDALLIEVPGSAYSRKESSQK